MPDKLLRTILSMVKVKPIIYILLFLTLTGCYVVVPKKYFSKYSSILANNPVDPNFFDVSKAYTFIWDTLDEEMSRKYNRKINNFHYSFFYANNLCAQITIPHYSNSTKQWIFDQEDYLKAVKQNLLNPTEDFSWYYFEIIDSSLIIYNVIFDVGNWNVMNRGKVVRSKGKIIKDAITYEHSKKRTIKKFNDRNEYIIHKTELTHKPDSSMADIYCMYSSQPKPYRRIYSENSPNYINPCSGKKLAVIKE
jgi:hypothetical protein